MANPNMIYEAFKKAGYLSVPSYYDKGRDNHCRVCGWENSDGYEQSCFSCYYQQQQYGREGKTIRGLSVASMSFEDYLIFRAINDGKTDGVYIDIDITIDNYVKEVKARNLRRIKEYQERDKCQQHSASMFD